MRVWQYKEEKETHLLVKFYKEDHGEGEFLGDLDEKSIRKMILDIKPEINIDQAFGTLNYFGLLPILVLKDQGSSKQ
ncbi:MAG: hypothetical protein DRG30_08320 [Epsilonproteobacteria bacterium]|nr:MAG: hypothetical protein DRG30_08320 [Campylobacterota bacterium]